MVEKIQLVNVFGEVAVDLSCDNETSILELKKKLVNQLNHDIDFEKGQIGGLFHKSGSERVILYSPRVGIFPDTAKVKELSEETLEKMIYYFFDRHLFSLSRIILGNGQRFGETAMCVILAIFNGFFPIVLPKCIEKFKGYSLLEMIDEQMLEGFNINIRRMGAFELIHQKTGNRVAADSPDALEMITHGDMLIFKPINQEQDLEDSIRILDESSDEDSLGIRILEDVEVVIQSSLDVNGVNISLVKGDIVDQGIDVIVTAANANLMGGGGVDGAIHSAAGSKLVRASKYLSPCATGSAVLTPGFDLKADWVIHAVGPIYRDGNQNEDQQLAGAYRASLQIAFQSGFKSIAFPAISTGVYGFPPIPAARIALKTVVDEIRSMQQLSLSKVVFVLFTQQDYDIYQQLIGVIGSENHG